MSDSFIFCVQCCRIALSVSPVFDNTPKGSATAGGLGHPHLSLPLEGKVPSEARRMRCHSALTVSPVFDNTPKGSAKAHTQGMGNPSPTPFVPDYTVGEAFNLPHLRLSLPLEGKVASEARRMRCHSALSVSPVFDNTPKGSATAGG